MTYQEVWVDVRNGAAPEFDGMVSARGKARAAELDAGHPRGVYVDLFAFPELSGWYGRARIYSDPSQIPDEMPSYAACQPDESDTTKALRLAWRALRNDANDNATDWRNTGRAADYADTKAPKPSREWYVAAILFYLDYDHPVASKRVPTLAK